MSVFQEVVSANEKYAADFGDKGELGLPPAGQPRSPLSTGKQERRV